LASSGDPRGVNYWIQVAELQQETVSPSQSATVATDIVVDPRGQNYWDAVLGAEQELVATSQSATAVIDISSDARGQNYWSEILETEIDALGDGNTEALAKQIAEWLNPSRSIEANDYWSYVFELENVDNE
jgi:hypothetical protein